MPTLRKNEFLIPYPTRAFTRPAFTVVGYTLLVPAKAPPDTMSRL